MDCKEFEKGISGFIARKLDYPTLKGFNEHMEKCENCREELMIQFFVTEGIQRLEDGGTFDLQAELDQRLNEARHKLRFNSRILRVGIALEILAAVMLAGIVIWAVV